MEPKLFLSTSPSIATIPFFGSFKSTFTKKPKLSSKTHVCLPWYGSRNTPFLGQSLRSQEKHFPFGNVPRTRIPFGPIRAAVKRRKEIPFDSVIQRDKKLKLVMKIRKILVSNPDRIMALRDMGRYRKALGLQKRRRFIALLRKYPAIFEIVEEGAYSLQFKLTPEAERLYMEELRIRNQMEDVLVVKLRKLLMMSLEKRILVEKISHLMSDFGLPQEFRDTICRRYPQYFKVVMTGRGHALELTHWDPELAVSAAELAEEENRYRELDAKDLIIDRPPRFNRVMLPKGLNLSRGEMRRIGHFRDMPYISPYSDFSALRSGTLEKEKHACGVIHEILSLTIEKKTLVDHLTHFREEFRFSQQLRGMLIRHPDMFYVSLKGERDSVFLREAYRDSHLVEKDRLLLNKEKLRSLVAVPRFPRRGVPRTDGDGAEGTDEPVEGSREDAGKEWFDIDDMVGDEFEEEEEDDDDYDDRDDLDDEYDTDDLEGDDDEVPPDFDEDGGSVRIGVSKLPKQVENLKNEEKVLAFPDGRPRERW